ncbi:hypothetical protein [Paenibacillus piscarius]|uniref:hypothetical protein n=1 Tax=Paenibacillus piscarius TaxID=1089681 RepID=UPI001EE80D5B|nr:hypothetical protein [Paenibacillus piscarius]
MGNKMEFVYTEVHVYQCACGKGNYSINWHTYRDDYFNEDTRKITVINCPDCIQTYNVSGLSLTHKVNSQNSGKAAVEMDGLCKTMVVHALKRYKVEMFNYVSNIPVARWHRLWKIGSPTLPTFRKNLKRDGAESTFKYNLSYGPSAIERILDTLKEMEIHDDQLLNWENELNLLKKEKRDAIKFETDHLFTGKLLKEYKTYEGPQY